MSPLDRDDLTTAEERAEIALLQSIAPGEPSVGPASLVDLPTELGGLAVRADDDVARWVGMYTGPLRDPFARWLGRLDRDRDALAFLLVGEGLPEGLVYVALVESGLQPLATSTSGCAGTWQLAAPTARAQGLRVDAAIDERRDPTLSTAAAAALLRELRDRFGSWDTALAAYNAGPARVEAGDPGPEARWFVAKVHAARIVGEQRERFGIVAQPPPAAPSWEVTMAPGPRSVEVLAGCAGVAPLELRRSNPALGPAGTPSGGTAVLVPDRVRFSGCSAW